MEKEEEIGRGCFEGKYIGEKQEFRNRKFLTDDTNLVGAYN